MSTTYDAIVVGARCAGSPTAMLLARKGYRVLLVDRARFPSDTISTHVVHPLAVGALRRWGLLDRLIRTGCPPIGKYTFDFGPVTVGGAPGTASDPVAYCARRTVLDKLLVDAAAEAGAEVREDFVVDEVLIRDGCAVGIKGHLHGGTAVSEAANLVIGADGRSSIVAEGVKPETYNGRPQLLAPYYSYWSGLPMDGRFETYVRPHRGFAAAPTHDGLTMVVGGWPFTEFVERKKDAEGNYLTLFDDTPFAERVRSAKREARVVGMPTPNYFRKPYGPGWALVGDAGYLKDPITAQGILDAFRDAESCVTALDQALRGTRSFDEAMGAHHKARDEHVMPMYEFTCMLAALEPPPPDLENLIGAMRANQPAQDQFAQMNAGTISPAEFMSPDNIGRIMAAAGP